MSLFKIIVTVLLATFFVLFGLRLKGLNEVYLAYDHPFLRQDPPFVIYQVDNPGEISELKKQYPRLIYWLDLKLSDDNQLMVQDHSKKLWPLKDVVEQNPDNKFVLNILDNVDNVHKFTAEQVKALKISDRVLIQSDFDTITQSTKDLEPMWLYGEGRTEQTKMLTLQSLYLETMAPVKADVYVTPFLWRETTMVNEAIVNEIHRRQKKIFAGPLSTQEQIESVKKLGVDGFILDKADLLGLAFKL